MVGLATSADQWEQATLSVKLTWLGLSRVGGLADMAYLSSRNAAYKNHAALGENHAWGEGVDRLDRAVKVIGEWWGSFVTRLARVYVSFHG